MTAPTDDSVVDTLVPLEIEGSNSPASPADSRRTPDGCASSICHHSPPPLTTVHALLEAAHAAAAAAHSCPLAAKAALRAEGAIELGGLSVASTVGGMPPFPLGFNWYHHPVKYRFFTGGACERCLESTLPHAAALAITVNCRRDRLVRARQGAT